MISTILISLWHHLRWLVSAFSSREDLILENLALRQQLLALHAKTTLPSTHGVAQAVLGRVAKVLVWMERASHFAYPENGCWLASGWLSAVLEMALQN